MYKRKTLVILLFWAVLAIHHETVDAGPMQRSRRIIREVYPPDIEPEADGNQPQVCIVGDVVYGVDEPLPAEQPCLKCRCQPPGVQCETIRCSKKPGCKAVHRPNSCCPDYQCECQYNGKIYGNGEKLETPSGGECKVCYCRGGEIQCADVSCYIRKDCEGKRVPGTCCPKYDHCPPIDALLEGSQYTTELTMKTIDHHSLEVLPLPSITQTTNETFLGQTTNEIQDEDKTENKHFEEELNLELKNKKLSQTAHDEIDELKKHNGEPKITIQEIIPEIKEIPITASPKTEDMSQTQGQLIIEETKHDDDANANDLVVTDAEPDSSEISEVFQQPPPVLRIGDKLLFLKKGEFVPEKDTSSPTSVITIIGAEGLQRGFEESAEIHEENEHKVAETTNLTESNDLELKTSESTHILSLVKRKKLENPLITTTTESVLINITEEVTSETSTATTAITNGTEISESTTADVLVTSDLPESLTTDGKMSETSTESVKHVETPEQNPAYPPIPDIMVSPGETGHTDDTSQRFDNENSEKQNSTVQIVEEIVDMKILPEVLEIRNNKTIPENTTNSDWLKTETVLNIKGTLPDELLNEPSPIDGVTEASFDNITETTIESIETSTLKLDKDDLVTEDDRSVESVEESTEDSGERTTEKSNHASLKSIENISLENETSELSDMLKGVAENSGKELTTISIGNDVEFIGEIQKTDDVKPEISKDVEIIQEKEDAETTARPEELPKPEKIVEYKSIGKRENSPDDEAEEVFKQLDKELNVENTERTQSPEEEQKEADEIFKDLLEETSTTKAPIAPEGRNKDADTLQRVSDALAKFTLRGKQPDSNILGILTNFFSSQYRYRK